MQYRTRARPALAVSLFASAVMLVASAGPALANLPAPWLAAEDHFDRSVQSGWGSAETGGPWTAFGPSSAFYVSYGSAAMIVPSGMTRAMSLYDTDLFSVDVRFRVKISRVASGGPLYVYAFARGSNFSVDELRPRVIFNRDGTISVHASYKKTGGYGLTWEGPIGSPVVVDGLKQSPTQWLWVRAQVSGSMDIKVKAWAAGTPEPGWQYEDTYESDRHMHLNWPGAVGLRAYVSRSAQGPVKFRFDSYSIWSQDGRL